MGDFNMDDGRCKQCSKIMDMGEQSVLNSPEKTQSGKLKSGILTRPNEAGIKKVVQYAHEKLDSVHVKK